MYSLCGKDFNNVLKGRTSYYRQVRISNLFQNLEWYYYNFHKLQKATEIAEPASELKSLTRKFWSVFNLYHHSAKNVLLRLQNRRKFLKQLIFLDSLFEFWYGCFSSLLNYSMSFRVLGTFISISGWNVELINFWYQINHKVVLIIWEVNIYYIWTKSREGKGVLTILPSNHLPIHSNSANIEWLAILSMSKTYLNPWTFFEFFWINFLTTSFIAILRYLLILHLFRSYHILNSFFT